jgi:hypothetical protein
MVKANPAKKLNKTAELLILSASLIIVLLLWDTYFIYPIKLFVVLLHELSHALVTFITGGTVKEIEIGFDLGGKINTAGGNDIAIGSAGYIGSLLIGLAIFVSAHITRYGKYFFFLLAGIVLLTLFNSNPSGIFTLLCIVMVAFLILFGMFIYKIPVSLFVKAVAISSSLYVLIDIKEDVFSKNLTSDAIELSNITGLNSTLIGIFWLAVSSFVIFVLIRLVYFGKKK